MTQTVIAGRYAQALFDLASEQQKVQTVQQQLREVKEAFEAAPALNELLHTPTVTVEQKKEVLASVLPGVDAIVLHTMYILIDNKRTNELLNVFEAYDDLANDDAGIAEAVAYTTHELSEDEKEKISSTFAQKLGKQSLRITNIVDPKLIGGLRLQVGNLIYDSSVQSRLERLKRQMIG